MLNKTIATIIKSYNARIAAHLSFYLAIPQEEVLYYINQMKENKR